MAKNLLRDYVFVPGAAGVGYIEVPGRYTLDKFLLITNVTDNIIIYNFADTTFAGTVANFFTSTSTNWPTVTTAHDGFTRLILQSDTSAMSASDDLQIFAEDKYDYGQKMRPWDFGTDAIERMRISQGESLIDADFEYGLQPTKWAGFGSVKGYPSTYDLPGVDLSVNTIITDFQTDNTTNSLITVTFKDSANGSINTAHGLSVGDVVNVSSLNAGTSGFSRADGSYIIESVPNSHTLKYYARGVVGSSDGDSLKTEETLVRKGALYSNAALPTPTSVTSDGADPSEITLHFAKPHGLVPGTPLHVIMGTGTNKDKASGPFFMKASPEPNQMKYDARPGAAVTSPANAQVFAISNATILHRPSDGGVILSTKTPTYAASVTRQTKRYFRYQSGKGFLFSSGTLFAPVYDLQAVTASGTSPGATITIKTDDIDHGLQAGASVELVGLETSGYSGTYTVNSITDDYTFTVIATGTLGDTTCQLSEIATVQVKNWVGAAVRAGMFDDQNGLYWEFDGQQIFVVQRTSTFNITGTIAVTQNSNNVVGSNTRFTEQLRAGSKISIKGMTHFVTNVESDTSFNMSPDYRGITASGVRGQKITQIRVPQSKWNLDKLDGTGPSGYTFNTSRMQMIGIEYSWYGAGFVHFMVRGSDGKWVYCHRIRNNNLNTEAFMRSGNLPVRYAIDNDSPITFLTSTIDSAASTIPVKELNEFSDNGTLLIDNEIMTYTGRSATDGPGNFTGVARAATLTQFLQGNNVTVSAGAVAAHSVNTGVAEISNTCSPTLSHWGSALVMDGGFQFDRGYLFNHSVNDFRVTTTPRTAFAIRLAPSVSNASVGRLGAQDLLNRSQMLLQEITVAMGRGFSQGDCICQGILNPKNWGDATWRSLVSEADGGQPSFAQYANRNDINWTTGSFALPGETIFSFSTATGYLETLTTVQDLSSIKQMDGAPLGGDFKYPDGPDILAINIFFLAGRGDGTIELKWSEAQA